MSVHGASITTISPDRDRIPRKNKKKNLSEILITGNEITQEPDNPNKKAKMDSSIDEMKPNLKLTPPPYTNKHEYIDGTNEKTCDAQTCESDDSPSDTDGCARNLDDEHKNEEDDNYIDPPSKK